MPFAERIKAVKTLDKLYTIIDLLEESGDMRLHEIAERLMLNKSTVYRFLSSLCEHGYLKKDEETSRYSLGLRFINIAAGIVDRLDLRRIAHPHLVDLEKMIGETIHLTVFDGKTVVYIDKVESAKPVVMYSKIGNIAPFYCTAVGKVILAYQSTEKVDELLNDGGLKKHTENTITRKDLLLKELARIKKGGFAVDNEEHEENICCIAAPLWHHDGKVAAAISISSVRSRMNLDTLLQYVPCIKEKSEVISRELGYKGNGGR